MLRVNVKRKFAQVEELEARLVKEIRFGRANSRLSLANLLKLAPSTVGIYVDRLIATGHLREASAAKSTAPGRPAQMLTLSESAGCFVGVEFEAETIHALCMDFSGVIVSRHFVNLNAKSDVSHVLKGLETAIDHVLAETDLKLLGIGVGVPGTVDATRGIARDYRFIDGWKEVPIAQRLNTRYNVPILLDNNARMAALGILMFEQDKKRGHFVSLLVRSGVGAGIVINGKLHRGDTFLAGEVGRIRISGPESSHSETIEDLTSLHRIVDFVQKQLREGCSSVLKDCPHEVTIQDVIAAVHEGDELARRTVHRAARGLGWLAHTLALIINPSSIILVGPLNAVGDWLRLEVQAALNEFAEMTHTDRPRILLSKLSDEIGAMGAASLAIDAWKPNRARTPVPALKE